MSDRVSVRLTTSEKALAVSLGNYLKERGKIDQSNVSEALRYSLRFLTGEILKHIEVARAGSGL